MKDLLSIVSHFQMQGTVREIKPLGSGLINDTYKVTHRVRPVRRTMFQQRINHAIFSECRDVTVQYRGCDQAYP